MNGNQQEDDEDRLRSIHNDLVNKGQVQEKSSPWLPLESNPEIFTTFASRVGRLPPEWQFVDVLGFDDDTLASISRPVAAVILLFPCTDRIYEARSREKRMLLEDIENGRLSPAAKKAYHLEQVSSFGNACGTIACVHSLTNAGLFACDANNESSPSLLAPRIAGPIAEFRDSTSALATSKERGTTLVSSGVLHTLSDEAASNTIAQTACPERGDTRLGHHYCAFVPVYVGVDDSRSIHLVELDGTKVCPVDHGRIGNGTDDLLQAAAAVVKERWMKLEPDRIDFSLMALSKTS